MLNIFALCHFTVGITRRELWWKKRSGKSCFHWKSSKCPLLTGILEIGFLRMTFFVHTVNCFDFLCVQQTQLVLQTHIWQKHNWTLSGGLQALETKKRIAFLTSAHSANNTLLQQQHHSPPQLRRAPSHTPPLFNLRACVFSENEKKFWVENV